jgi:hypothetical protein
MNKIKKWLINHYDGDAGVLFGPIFIIMIIDMFLTVVEQPTLYWTNPINPFANADETNRLGKWLLEIHPLFFIYAFLLYLTAVYLAMCYLDKVWKFFLFVIILIFHGDAVLTRLYPVFESLVKTLPQENISRAKVIAFIKTILQFLAMIYSAKVWIKYFELKNSHKKNKNGLAN